MGCYNPWSEFIGVNVESVAMRPHPIEMSETVVPFAPAPRERVSNDGDPLDNAGQTIMGFLQQAAGVAKEEYQYALDGAHKLLLQLRATEGQVKALEADVRHYQDR